MAQKLVIDFGSRKEEYVPLTPEEEEQKARDSETWEKERAVAEGEEGERKELIERITSGEATEEDKDRALVLLLQS